MIIVTLMAFELRSWQNCLGPNHLLNRGYFCPVFRCLVIQAILNSGQFCLLFKHHLSSWPLDDRSIYDRSIYDKSGIHMSTNSKKKVASCKCWQAQWFDCVLLRVFKPWTLYLTVGQVRKNGFACMFDDYLWKSYVYHYFLNVKYQIHVHQ